MVDEFPEMEYREYQNDFLQDWWSRKKLFEGDRQTGKSELLASELNRFLNRGFNCCVLAPTQQQSEEILKKYKKRFNTIPNCKFISGTRLTNRALQGNHYDVVLVDEVQNISKEKLLYEIDPVCSMFVRASASKEISQRKEEYFDSIYTN